MNYFINDTYTLNSFYIIIIIIPKLLHYQFIESKIKIYMGAASLIFFRNESVISGNVRKIEERLLFK